MDTSAWGQPAPLPSSRSCHGKAGSTRVPRREAIRAEQIRLLYANAPAGFVATGLNAGLLALVQWSVIPPLVILAWLTYMLGLTVLRAMVVWRFQRVAPAPHAMGPWGILFGLGTGLAGIGWGSAGVVLFPDTSMTHQVFLTFVLGGMIAGAVGLLAARMPVFLSFACPTAVPVILHWLAQGDRLATTMGGMAALFTLVSIFTAYKLHGIILASVHLRFDNADLVASVVAEKGRVEHLNTQLTVEIAERQRAEEALRTAHEALEVRVQERTAELAMALAQLQAEMHERQQLAEQLRQAQKMEAIGTLAGGIAHDFNNILAAILGFAELATSHLPPSSTVWHYLQAVLTAGKRARDLVQQILAFSRKQSSERQRCHLQPLLKETLTLLRAVLPSTIVIHQHIAEEAGAVVVDPIQIHQVVMNLCTNAEHAMRDTGGLLEVGLAVVDIDASLAAQHPALTLGPYVRLTVRDTGHGMTPEVVQRIFDPYFTTKVPGEGTGMGLAVVHGIVLSHGGAITVASTPRQGTAFAVYLPQMAEGASPREAPPLTPLPLGKECILFVDDEAALAAMGQAMLERLGYEVVACSSSLEALETFRAAPRRFDLVITDQTMPYLTGEALVRTLRDIRPDVPIILCTGFSHSLDAQKAQALGINAFLMKPWQGDDLARAVREALGEGQ
jgi:signal transduction histidine kinase